jgi:predicted nucleic acid-binding protein
MCSSAPPELRREYEHILRAAVRVRGYDPALDRFVANAEVVEPDEIPDVVSQDPDDNKLVGAAMAGQVEAIITNDRHLLDLDPYGAIRIVRPREFLRLG